MKHRRVVASRSSHVASTRSRPLLVRLLGFYPTSWRERYGEELSDLLANEPVTPLALASTLWGALDAHLHPDLPTPGLWSCRGERLRLAALAAFGASLGALMTAGFFLDAVDDLSFPTLMRTHPTLQWPWLVLVVGAIVVGVSLVAGVLPIILAVVQDARRRRSATVRLLAIPPLALLVLLGGDAVERAWGQPGTSGVEFLIDVLLHVLYVIAVAVSAGAISLAILRSQITERLFRWALAPAACGTFGLGVMLAASLLWLLRARSVAPADFAQSDITLNFVLLIVLMLVTTLGAARGVLWGLTARRKNT